MSVLDDDVSVVSGSTNLTDNTQNLQIADLFENPRIFERQKKDTSGSTDQDINTRFTVTGDCEMSPLVPLQMSKLTQKSGSEISELLIPVISKKSSATVQTICLQKQESQFPEESQSLLPQLPVSSCSSVVPGKDGEDNTDTREKLSRNENNADPSQSSVCSTVMSHKQNSNQGKAQDIPKKDTEDSECLGLTVQAVKSLKNKSCIQGYFVFKSYDLLDKTQNMSESTSRSKKSANLMEPQSQAVSESLSDLQNDQRMICKTQQNISLSQSQSISNGREGENTQASQSQRTVTLTSQGKDPVDRIITRLDRLVSSLDKVPRRQMMVIEQTVLQCITSLQDSLNNKLNKQASVCSTSTLRKLLQTTQNGLTKLTEQHKQEKSQLVQTGTQSTQQIRSQQNQTGVNDLGNRQKKVFDLLKRQKHLVELYKTRNRPTSVPAYTDPVRQRNSIRSKIRSENGQESQRSKKGRLRTATEKGMIITTSIKPDKKKKCKEQPSKSTLDSSCLKEVVSNNFKDTNYNVDAQFIDIKSRKESEDQLNTELQSTEFENCVISQDLTTVPDTQDLSTENTFKASVKDLSKAKHDLAFDKTSAGLPAEFTEKKDEGGEILNGFTGDNETGTGISLRKDENATNSRIDAYDVNELREDKVEDTENNEKVKTIRLSEDECVNKDVDPKDKTKVSEILWLNMLRDVTEEPVESKKKTVPLTGPKQELFTARKMNEIKEMPVGKEAVNVSNCNAEFTFTKALIFNTNIKESDNVMSLPKEIKKVESCLKRNTKLFNETRHWKSIEEKSDTNGKNGKVIDGLSSPPNAVHPGETWHNVSPTATSMSSDVFMVKMKDLQKRMKRRNMELEQTEELPLAAASKNHDSKDDKSHRQRISDQDNVTEKLGRGTENNEICNEDTEKEHDTISEAIDSVIEQTRVIAARQKTEDIKEQMPEGAYEMGSDTCRNSENIQPGCQVWKKPYISAADPGYASLNSTSVVKEKQQLTSLPTLRDLVHSGKLVPGRAVLSCQLKGRTHRASLTPLGKIRTQEGLVLTTASQWVSTLTDGIPVKKRQAYEMVLYQDRQLLSFCKARPGCVNVPSMPALVTKEIHLQPGIPKPSVDQGVQVEESEFINFFQSSSKMSEDERRLNELLSNSVIRLLTEKDFVPCDDLPDNFWTEDFSKVKLHKDIWDAVDAW